MPQEALDYNGEIQNFFSDLSRHGCVSGMISSLIYYHDTHRFYDKHYEEIEALRYNLDKAFGSSLTPEGHLTNWYAWMAFEETALRLIAHLVSQIDQYI